MPTTNPGADRAESFDHEFKSHPDVFWPAARGEKTFEYRRDDRGGYEVGQTVRLRCYDHDRLYHPVAPLDRRITNILRGGEFELPQGYCILGLAPLSASAPASGAETATPAARWHARGEADPHGDRYNCPRERLCGGHLTDDEVAGQIAMLSRNDLNHEAVLSTAKDHLRWLSRRVVALEATPAPAAAQGVPDSVRALLKEVSSTLCNAKLVLGRAGKREKAVSFSQTYYREAQRCSDTLENVRTLLATHPAGQTGKMRRRPDDDKALDGLATDLIVDPDESEAWRAAAGIHSAGQSAGSGALTAEEIRRTSAEAKSPSQDPAGQSTGQGAEPRAPLTSLKELVADKKAVVRANKPAHDSTRTGDEGADGIEAIAEVLWRSDHPAEDDVCWTDWLAYVEDAQYPVSLTRDIEHCRRRARAIVAAFPALAALAARPAAPEAQGAWRPINDEARDGKHWLVAQPGSKPIRAYFENSRWWMHGADRWCEQPADLTGAFEPTHYQPLPAPPSSGQEG